MKTEQEIKDEITLLKKELETTVNVLAAAPDRASLKMLCDYFEGMIDSLEWVLSNE